MASYSKVQEIGGLIGWLAVSFIASAIGAVASLQADQFYTKFIRPDWAPPPFIFGPVWTVLYALMGIAAWLVWRAEGFRAARVALTLFLLQLIPNAAWTWLFFARQQGGLAFWDILLLWVLIVATMVAFWRIRPVAGVLLVPYLLWVSFASVLNYAMWQLNPGLLG